VKPTTEDAQSSSNFRSTWAIPFLIAGVVSLVVANEVSYQRSITATAALENTLEIRLGVQKLKELSIDAETGQRGYLLTGKEAYLTPYKASIAQIDGTLDFLRNRLAGNQEQLAQFAAISRMLARKLGEMELSVELRQKNQEIAWRSVIETDQGKDYMDAMREAARKLTESVDKNVSTHQAQIRQTLVISRFTIGTGAVLSVIAFLLYLRQSRRLVAVEKAAKHRLSLERDNLEKEVAQRTTKLSELANYLETAREDERAHLARELHDEMGALLTAAKLDVSRLRSRLQPLTPEVSERIDHLGQSLNAGIALKRQIVEGLRPSSLSHLGLLPTLEILAKESAERSGVNIETQLEPVVLDEAMELTIYRFVQESLTNVTKYSAAKNVLIELQSMNHYAQLSVKDDGIGFDPQVVKRASYGLTGMRQRVEAAGGRIEIQSAPGAGTTLTAWLPQRQPEKLVSAAMLG
jgi:signal transduction histidine kinase